MDTVNEATISIAVNHEHRLQNHDHAVILQCFNVKT